MDGTYEGLRFRGGTAAPASRVSTGADPIVDLGPRWCPPYRGNTPAKRDEGVRSSAADSRRRCQASARGGQTALRFHRRWLRPGRPTCTGVPGGVCTRGVYGDLAWSLDGVSPRAVVGLARTTAKGRVVESELRPERRRLACVR